MAGATPQADLTRVSEHITGAELPPGAVREVSHPLSRDAGGIQVGVNPRTGESYAREDWHTMSPAERAKHNERELQPLTATGPKQPAAPPAHGPTTGGIAEAIDAVSEGKLDPFYANLRSRAPHVPAAPIHTDAVATTGAKVTIATTQQPAAPKPAGGQGTHRWHRESRAPRSAE